MTEEKLAPAVGAESALDQEETRYLRDLTFLAEASSLLGSSLDYKETLTHLVQLIVPFRADWCAVHLMDEDGSIRLLAAAHADAAKVRLARKLENRHPTDPEAPHGLAAVLRSGKAEAYPDLTEELLHNAAQTEPHLAQMRRLGLRSAIIIPLQARGKTFGAVTVGNAESGRRFDSVDLATLEDLAARAALAIENARLYRSLENSERYLRSLVENLNVIIWEAEPESLAFKFVSKGAEELLGYPLEDWTRNPDFWPTIIHPEDREATVLLRRTAVAQGLSHDFDYRVQAADGRILWVRDLVFVEPGPGGKTEALRGLMIDATRRKIVEAQLRESNRRVANLARTLQQSLLPAELPEIEGMAAAAFYRAAGEGNEVGGDFYDVFPLEGGGWAATIGDVQGKGPHAAAVTALARYTIRAAAMSQNDPEGVLDLLNRAVLQQVSDERFCTVVFGCFQPKGSDFEVTLGIAGHPQPYIVRSDGAVERVGASGLPVGCFPDPEIRQTGVLLKPGDALVLYTDGVTEAGAPDNALGDSGLAQVVAEAAALPPEEIVARIEHAAMQRQRGAPRDDCAAIVLKVVP
ncbi:MAG: GAF domain-containing SpoIIE family protein phosphatase [Actinomycetota bacterium]